MCQGQEGHDPGQVGNSHHADNGQKNHFLVHASTPRPNVAASTVAPMVLT